MASDNPKAIIAGFADKLKSKVIKQATVRAVNRTLTTVRAEASRTITEHLKLKAKDAKDAITMTKAVPKADVEDIVGLITIRGRPLPLSLFSPKERIVKVQANRFGSTRTGVTVNIKGQRKLVPGGFLRTLASGHVAVLARKNQNSNNSRPTKELKTTSVVDIFKTPGVMKDLARNARATFAKNLRHELQYQLDRMNKQGND